MTILTSDWSFRDTAAREVPFLRREDDSLEESLELLEGAENGRYKVVAKAEPYKNLPVSITSEQRPHFLRALTQNVPKSFKA